MEEEDLTRQRKESDVQTEGGAKLEFKGGKLVGKRKYDKKWWEKK